MWYGKGITQLQNFINKLNQVRIDSIFKKRPCLGPNYVNIHITNVCNLKCIFCWDRSPLIDSTHNNAFHVDFNVLKNVITDCSKIGVHAIGLEGGEVALYPSIEKLSKLIKQYGMKLEIYSNCCFDTVLRNVLLYADKVKINLSATNSFLYKIIHGTEERGMFKKVISNITKLSKLKKRYGKPKIQLIFIINDLNYSCMKEIIDFGEKLQIDEITFKLVEATIRTKDLILSSSSIIHLKKILKRLKSKKLKIKHNIQEISAIVSNKDFKKNCYGIRETDFHNDRYFYYRAFPEDRMSCYVGWFCAFIDLKGEVVAPCDNVGVAFLGNIYKQSFKNIWFSDSYQRLRTEARESIDPASEKWQECQYCGFVDFNRNIAKRIKKKLRIDK